MKRDNHTLDGEDKVKSFWKKIHRKGPMEWGNLLLLSFFTMFLVILGAEKILIISSKSNNFSIILLYFFLLLLSMYLMYGYYWRFTNKIIALKLQKNGFSFQKWSDFENYTLDEIVDVDIKRNIMTENFIKITITLLNGDKRYYYYSQGFIRSSQTRKREFQNWKNLVSEKLNETESSNRFYLF